MRDGALQMWVYSDKSVFPLWVCIVIVELVPGEPDESDVLPPQRFQELHLSMRSSLCLNDFPGPNALDPE